MPDDTNLPSTHIHAMEDARGGEGDDCSALPKRPREEEPDDPGNDQSGPPDQSHGAIDKAENAPKKASAPRRKKQKGEPMAPQKPHMLFLAETLPKVREEYPELGDDEVKKEARKRWKEASKETKAVFTAKAEADKKRHEEEHAAWVRSQEEAKQREAAERNEVTLLMERTVPGGREGMAEEDVARLVELVAMFQEKFKRQRTGCEEEKAAWVADLERFPMVLKICEEEKQREKQREKEEKKRKKSTTKEGSAAAPWDPITSLKPPPKARTAYALYTTAEKARLAAEYTGRGEALSAKELTKKVQAAWKQLRETEDGRAVRARYELEAKQDLERYKSEYEAWWGHRSEEERQRIAEENAKKAEAKATASLKLIDLVGAPDGLTKQEVITFMQIFIPRHYLDGETLAWREFIEPSLREAHPDLQWENNPDPSVDKSALVKSMKSIWKHPDVIKPLPKTLDQMLLLDEETARVSTLESYIKALIADIENSRRAELAETLHEKRVEAEERTLEVEKFAYETCLVWWSVVTRKPTLHALGTDVKALKFIAEMIQKRWFPRGAPGKDPVDWEAKEEERKRHLHQKHWRKADMQVNSGKLTSKVVDGKIVWVVEDANVVKDGTSDGAERNGGQGHGGHDAGEDASDKEAEAKRDREVAEDTMIAAYTIKIENHLKSFIRTFDKSVDKVRLTDEVLSRAGIVFFPPGWQKGEENNTSS